MIRDSGLLFLATLYIHLLSPETAWIARVKNNYEKNT